MVTKTDISTRASSVYQFIHRFQQKNGYAPSLPEIRDGTDIKSLRGVTIQLDKLERLGYIRRNKHARRAVQIINKNEETAKIPLVGEIQAGSPTYVEQHIEEYKEIPLSLLHGRKDAFLLRVKGNSMDRAGYYPGDIVVVVPQLVPSNGDVVVACNTDESEATLKKFKMMDGYCLLIPRSSDSTYKPFIGNDYQIQGKVIGKL